MRSRHKSRARNSVNSQGVPADQDCSGGKVKPPSRVGLSTVTSNNNTADKQYMGVSLAQCKKEMKINRPETNWRLMLMLMPMPMPMPERKPGRRIHKRTKSFCVMVSSFRHGFILKRSTFGFDPFLELKTPLPITQGRFRKSTMMVSPPELKPNE